MKSYERTGVLQPSDTDKISKERLKKGPVVVIECVENIPCDPCVHVCPESAIEMDNINEPPSVEENRCTGCGICVTRCPGLAIFVIDMSKEGLVRVTVPYEYLPIPKKGDEVMGLDREGNELGKVKVIRVREHNRTHAVTLEAGREHSWDLRGFRVIP